MQIDIKENAREYYKTIDEYSLVHQGCDLEVIQLSRGDLNACGHYIELNNIRLISRYSDACVLERGVTSNDFELYIPIIGTNLLSHTNGHLFGTSCSHSVVCSAPNQEIESIVPACNGYMIIKLSKKSVKNFLSHQDYVKFKLILEKRNELHIADRKVIQLSSYLYQLINGLSKESVPISNERLVDDMECEILENIFNVFLCNDTSLSEVQYITRYRIVDKAIDIIEQNVYKNILINDLADECHTSIRTLQLAFQDKLGLSPLQYVKSRRLLAMHGLLKENNKGYCIQHLAKQLNYSHMGNLAKDYFGLFNELPSDTLVAKS